VKRYIAEKNNTTGINVFVTLIYKLENYDVQLEYLYKIWNRSHCTSVWSTL